ncbi:hypothetical protein, partial [Kitasatospora sp. NPDC059803]|uniref:hypothetical protein n=1 Tax=Kitasatospora sp. NPDC059803 TaxID=3346953 RepID=UPI00364F9537
MSILAALSTAAPPGAVDSARGGWAGRPARGARGRDANRLRDPDSALTHGADFAVNVNLTNVCN